MRRGRDWGKEREEKRKKCQSEYFPGGGVGTDKEKEAVLIEQVLQRS